MGCNNSDVDPDFKPWDKTLFLTFPVEDIIYGKEKIMDKILAILYYLKEHLPKHKFLVYANNGTNSDFVCNFSTERIFKRDGLFIYIKKLKRQENFEADIDSTDFKAWFEFFVRELSSQSLSISDQATKLHEKIVAKCGKNVVVYIVKEEYAACGCCYYRKKGFTHNICLNGYKYAAFYYSN
jgi:hypothetical protein